jgi:two-component system, cell cycle sensor histidine kinase and response regulator CckA
VLPRSHRTSIKHCPGFRALSHKLGRTSSVNYYRMSLNKYDSSSHCNLFDGFFQLIPDLAVVISSDGRLLRVNPAFERSTGFSAEESLARSFVEFIHPDDLPPVSAKLSEVFERTGATEFVARFLCKDGFYKWIEWQATIAPETHLALATGRNISEGKDRKLATIFSSVSDVLFLAAVEGEDRYRFLTINNRFVELSGLPESEIMGKYLEDLVPPHSLPVVQAHYRNAIRRRTTVEWEDVAKFPAGVRHGVIRITPLFDETGRCTYIVGAVQDLTERDQSEAERQKLEEQLRQAQKLESLGRLAGGVSHDFNNLLTVIQGYAQLLQQCLAERDPRRAYVDRISDAGQQAARLTSQLLAFSRKQLIRLEPLNLNGIIQSSSTFLQTLVGENISLITVFDPELGYVMANHDQIHQVLMNLVANACDAMLDGGSVTIGTSQLVIDEGYVRVHPDATEGPCVVMTITDTGVGMDERIRRNIFEPFFTTKEPGKGTGLGLATVYGIIHQFNGWIDVESCPGHGTQFRIYLPRIDRDVVTAANTERPTAAIPLSGSETILLVEDEEGVRQLSSEVLVSHGYSVLCALSGADALQAAATHWGPIHLLITDIVMQGMTGRELAERLTALRPETRVLFISGYADDVLMNRGVTDSAASFLAKPFNAQVLAAKVRDILNRGSE